MCQQITLNNLEQCSLKIRFPYVKKKGNSQDLHRSTVWVFYIHFSLELYIDSASKKLIPLNIPYRRIISWSTESTIQKE